DVLVSGDAPTAIARVYARGPALRLHAPLHLTPHARVVHRFLHREGADAGHSLVHQALVVVGEAAAHERGDRDESAEGNGVEQTWVKIGAETARADVADEIHQARGGLVEQPRHTGNRLPDAVELDVRHALQLD